MTTVAIGGMESAVPCLKRMTPELVVSKQKLRQAEGSCMVRLKREEGKQNVGFSSRPFVLCGLPVRKPPEGEMLYERRNGDFVLQITGHPNYGLPFGQDRIVPIYLATLAVRQQSQTIRFRTAAEMLETFGMHKGGKEYRRLVAAFERIFGATIFFGTDTLQRNSQGGPAIAVQFLPRGPDLVQPRSGAVPGFRSIRECDCAERRVLPGDRCASDSGGSRSG